MALLSKQLKGYVVESGLSASGSLDLGLTRDATDENKLGFNTNVSIQGKDKLQLTQVFNYKVNDKISASLTTSLNTDQDINGNVGVHYRIST